LGIAVLSYGTVILVSYRPARWGLASYWPSPAKSYRGRPKESGLS